MPDATSAAIAEAVKQLVLDDIRAQLLPQSVSSFEELHEYVDANTYLLEATNAGGVAQAMPADVSRYNEAIEIVHRWLASGEHRSEL